MDVVKRKWKKALERCKSSKQFNHSTESINKLFKSKSWPPPPPSSSPSQTPSEVEKVRRERRNRQHLAPEGCFSVYVGPGKQRFVVELKYVNHPLFKMLLEDAELQYGYNSDAPLMLPCDVDLFYRVLVEMESDEVGDEIRSSPIRLGCGINFGSGFYSPLSPSRSLQMNQF
ncbi:hypothetical protein Ancab_039169 [Ancistrocladus abbreviatus]